MKKIFISVLSLVTFSGITPALAQEDKIKDNKQEEIIIRKNEDKDIKVTVEIKGDDVLINGKPLSEFKDDDVAVIKRKKIVRHGNDLFMGPENDHINFFNKSDNDSEESRPFLGVTTDRDESGARINNVAKGSAAEKAGLKEGDIITKIGSKNIDGPEDLTDAVRSYKPKDEIKIYYKRNGKSNDTKAVLGEKKESLTGAFYFNNDHVPGMDKKIFKDFNFTMPPNGPFVGKSFNNMWGMAPNKKLGVRIEDADNDAGAKIINVEEGSVAEKAGLKKDDIITEVDGKKIENINDAREEILENDKTNYTIKAKRNGTDMNFEIKTPKNINSADL